ncbi:hypothetical protein ACRE1S_00635 [Helicobacter himalayensis]|uniref:hypothetical protein n=1 Tax=Helicobacter himalayensis TaxID=1591088 RepID=UPI003D6F72D2
MKILTICAFCVSLAFGESGIIQALQSQFQESSAQSKRIEGIFKERDVNVKVLKVQNLGNGLDFVIVQEEKQGERMPLLVTNNGAVIMPASDVWSDDKEFSQKLESVRSQFQQEKREGIESKILEIFSKRKEAVITFKAKPHVKNPKTFYIVSDANCPYCHSELEHLDERLESGHVKMIVVGFLDLSSVHKAAKILEEKSNDEAKNLILLKKYYNKERDNIGFSPKINQVMQYTKEISASGVRGVPYIIERD